MYTWDFQFLGRYLVPLLAGLATTLWISACAVVLGTALGIPLAMARRSGPAFLRYIAIGFIEALLAMPVLVLLVWAYYCLPLITPIRLSPESTAVLVFSASLAAFVAETLRSGIDAVPVGQVEAGLALSLSRLQVYRFIILPQALRVMLPALLTQYLTCLKLSSLASVIAVYELLHTANGVVLVTYRPLEVYTIVALLFLVVILPINIVVRALERKWGRGLRS